MVDLPVYAEVVSTRSPPPDRLDANIARLEEGDGLQGQAAPDHQPGMAAQQAQRDRRHTGT